jgi:hypothetical protein
VLVRGGDRGGVPAGGAAGFVEQGVSPYLGAYGSLTLFLAQQHCSPGSGGLVIQDPVPSAMRLAAARGRLNTVRAPDSTAFSHDLPFPSRARFARRPCSASLCQEFTRLLTSASCTDSLCIASATAYRRLFHSEDLVEDGRRRGPVASTCMTIPKRCEQTAYSLHQTSSRSQLRSWWVTAVIALGSIS